MAAWRVLRARGMAVCLGMTICSVLFCAYRATRPARCAPARWPWGEAVCAAIDQARLNLCQFLFRIFRLFRIIRLYSLTYTTAQPSAYGPMLFFSFFIEKLI